MKVTQWFVKEKPCHKGFYETHVFQEDLVDSPNKGAMNYWNGVIWLREEGGYPLFAQPTIWRGVAK